MKLYFLWLPIMVSLVQYQTGFALFLNNSFQNDEYLCRKEESQWLLQLKQLLPPQEELDSHQRCPNSPTNYSRLMHWSQSRDCCSWDGVTCDRSTGHVIGLDISCSALTGNIDSNSSLFRLIHLRKLSLAYNDFTSSKISFKFGQLSSLTHLNLSLTGFFGHFPAEFYHLSNLVSLDVTKDHFDPIIYCDIKALFGNMTKLRVVLLEEVTITSELPLNMSSFLTHLDLSSTDLQGSLPVSIFEKPNLQILNLGGNDGFTGALPSFNRSNVGLIEKLEIWGTNVSGRLPDSIGYMHNLNRLLLADCKFLGQIPDSIGNLTKTTEINLSGNEFNGEVPSTITNLHQLTLLDLSKNHLQGQLPDAFSHLQKLTKVDLSGNGFTGAIPYSLTNISQLKEVDLSSNALAGLIPLSLTNMSGLEWMDISSNKLTGPLPSGAGNGLQKLSSLYANDNSIQGTVPPWLLTLPSLVSLSLSSNNLTGSIDMFNSQSLIDLYLDSNQLNVKLESFYNLTLLQHLFLSYNTVIEQGHSVANVTLPNLGTLTLSTCGIEAFPDMLTNLTGLSWLDLSNNEFHGPIPNWFSSLPWSNGFTYLNLSMNYLTHATNLPWHQLQSLMYLDLHSNSLQDTIPSSICNMTELSILNLSTNKFRGTIPECIGTFSYRIKVLDLRRNELRGKIPSTFTGGENYELLNLGLNENHLEGPLPRSLANCSYLEVIDVGNNMMQDTFPWWLQNLTRLKVLILKSNNFHGSIPPTVSNNSFSDLQILDLSYNNFSGNLPYGFFAKLEAMKKQDEDATVDLYMGSSEYRYSMTLSVKGVDREFTRVLSIFTTIDLSRNNFNGRIPESLTYLSILRLLNLSHNSFSGSIPGGFGRMTKLEQLDLSSNQLTGGIPQALTNLTFLAILNLSHNHLVGPIPKGNQFGTFSNDSYIGNSGLCGDPLTRRCRGEREARSRGEYDHDQEEEDDGFMMGFTWKSVVMGYGCGVVLGFIMGYVMVSIQKPKWLARFVYVEAAIILRRNKKKRTRMIL